MIHLQIIWAGYQLAVHINRLAVCSTGCITVSVVPLVFVQYHKIGFVYKNKIIPVQSNILAAFLGLRRIVS
jgi:hypothetical protein